ncbi:sensor histidine kinase [Patulibacter defluvii]|uniref:sensor histidine kinase n=1 Tax=Patulibacter defluvii TaxID=3095358 RepID=UPI002A7558DB|nr:sensor histidine kinase [Patulibacter sp. DM4]
MAEPSDRPDPEPLPAVLETPRWLAALWTYGPSLVPLAIGAVAAIGLGYQDPRLQWWLLAPMATAILLATRLRWPFASWIASQAVVLSGASVDNSGVYLLLLLVPVLPLAALSAAWPARRSVPAALATTLVLALTASQIEGVAASSQEAVDLALGVALPAMASFAAWLVGYALHTRRRYSDALLERALWLERERDAQSARAVAEERTRIARELHDVVSHNVAVMVVQASAADAVWETAPDRARDALRAVEETGRSAMQELRAMLQAMRGGEDEAEGAERRAQQGLARLGELVEHVRAAGLDVELEVRGDLGRLGPATDVSLLRVAQEALTNVLRHARASRAEVAVTVADETVVLRIADDGVGLVAAREDRDALDPERRGGHGIVGMRERVAVLSGTIAIGPGPIGGTVVEAVVPLTPALPRDERTATRAT